ncbi:unnamed protein product [Microthlaspi erraticum]|uniref:F-box domain-containing protein n=1 Tax=Microthlaspi erraticum TaxID=1685480 RepID=A0A6D2HBR1_9BRAS|nr:unnamed protein product [Microthlaspi erraticum]
MTMMISNLPRDLVEEILSRVPLLSMKAVRHTCRNWNVLTKNHSFAIMHIGKAAAREKDFLMITEDCGVDLVSINLHGIGNNVDLSIKRKGTLVSQENSAKVLNISHVFNCNGLLALLSSDTELVVWNPYWGKTRCIKLGNNIQIPFSFALGYDKSSGSHMIFKIFNHGVEIYDLKSNSNSWKVLDDALDRDIKLLAKPGVSLKGNTYWFAIDNDQEGFSIITLVCFDFTRKRFGPRLPLPFHCEHAAYVSLATVREEKLAVSSHRWNDFKIEIWVTSKIEPDAVSWSCFLKFEIMLLFDRFKVENFFIDEEKKVAVVFYETYSKFKSCCIIGEKAFLRSVYLTNSTDIQLCRLVSSYVPTPVQLV